MLARLVKILAVLAKPLYDAQLLSGIAILEVVAAPSNVCCTIHSAIVGISSYTLRLVYIYVCIVRNLYINYATYTVYIRLNEEVNPGNQ